MISLWLQLYQVNQYCIIIVKIIINFCWTGRMQSVMYHGRKQSLEKISKAIPGVWSNCSTRKFTWMRGAKEFFFLKLMGTGEQRAILGNMAHKKSKLDFGKRLFKGNKGTDEPHHEKTCLQGYQPGMTQTECSATDMSQRLEILDIESIDIILFRQMHRLICIFVVRIWHKQDFSWWGSYIPYNWTATIFSHVCARHWIWLSRPGSSVGCSSDWYLCPPPKGRGTYCFWCGSCWRRRQRDTFLSHEPVGGF